MRLICQFSVALNVIWVASCTCWPTWMLSTPLVSDTGVALCSTPSCANRLVLSTGLRSCSQLNEP